MVHLTRIYTRTGDDGTTNLANLSRVAKTDPRIEAIGQVQEVGTQLGVARAQLGSDREDIATVLAILANDLFDLGADLSTPLSTHADMSTPTSTADDPPASPSTPQATRAVREPLRLDPAAIARLEAWCDRFNAELAPLDSFILPGGSLAGAQLHLAAAVIRRAERAVWRAIEAVGTGEGGINPDVATWLNRCSDLAFILARCVNTNDPEPRWVPRAGAGAST